MATDTHLFTLHKPYPNQLEKLVGGEIEIIYIDENTQLVVNDMHEFNNKPINKRATSIYRKVYNHGEIYGDAVVLEGNAS